MEIKNYLRIISRWGWLLVLVGLLFAAGGYVYSLYQRPVYRASTMILVQKPTTDPVNNTSVALNDKNISATFTQMIVTSPIIQQTSNQLGYAVDPGGIIVEALPGTDLIRITVEDHNARHAADIANMIATVFIQENNNVQASRFASSEQSLQTQVNDLQSRITDLQSQLNQVSEASYNKQVNEVTQKIADLQAEISSLQSDVVQLNYQVNPPHPYDPNPNPYVRSTPAPTPSAQQQLELMQKQDKLNQDQSLLAMYQKIYVDLTNNNNGSAQTNNTRSDQIKAALDQSVQSYTTLMNNLEALRMARTQAAPNILQVDQAYPASKPVRPNPLVNSLLAGVVGVMLAGGFAFFKEYTDDTLRTPEEVSTILEVPVLGYIGDMRAPRLKSGQPKMPYVLAAPRSPVTEAFRSLRANIDFTFTEPDREIKSLMLTSTTLSEGKTTIAVNLAVVIAQLGRRVILVDADLRRPHVHQVLGIQNLAGLSDVLRGQATLQEVGHPWGSSNLIVITSGSLPPNPAEILSSERMSHVLNDMENSADIVIIDSPPSLLADASALAARADGVLLVIQSNKTHLTAATNMIEQLQRVGANIVGVAMNRVNTNGNYYRYDDLKNYSSYAYDVEKTQPNKKTG